MTNDKKQPGLPVVEVDQVFPLMTTDGVSGPRSSSGITGDQAPAVAAAIRDVLGWRPRAQDSKAFTAALAASFELSTVEDHVVARYVPRGVAVQADLGGVTGGQASLYLRAKAAHEQITRMLDSLQPLRTDADPEDCEAYRGLVRDSVRRIVNELGREGGPRVPLVDSAFSVLTGYQPKAGPQPSAMPPNTRPGLAGVFAPRSAFGVFGKVATPVPTAVAEVDPDSVPGQLGALRDRFGLDDDHVNTVQEEKHRTSFWTLVELVTDLQRSWDTRRLDFTLGAGNGFLGTDLVQISRLLAAASEQVDELEAVLDSVLVSDAERQTVVLDRDTGLTLSDLVQWLRVFVAEDGPNIIRDTGRDGLVSTFTPTAAALLLTLRDKLVRRLVPCGGPSCAGGCTCGSRGQVTCIPLGCCTPLPPGMYSGRVKVAVSTLCGLVERLTAKAMRIGRFAGAVLLDLSVVPFETDMQQFVRVEVRGLHLRSTYVPAFVADGGNPANFGSLVLPLQGSASADDDSLAGTFQRGALPKALRDLLDAASDRGVLMAASEVPLAIVDGELGRLVQGPTVTTWPRLRPAGVVAADGGPGLWSMIPPNQRFVPQSPPDPVDPEVGDDCLEDCGEDCEGCDCGCHPLKAARAGVVRVRDIVNDEDVRARASDVRADLFSGADPETPNWLAMLEGDNLTALVDAILAADSRRAGRTTMRGGSGARRLDDQSSGGEEVEETTFKTFPLVTHPVEEWGRLHPDDLEPADQPPDDQPPDEQAPDDQPPADLHPDDLHPVDQPPDGLHPVDQPPDDFHPVDHPVGLEAEELKPHVVGPDDLQPVQAVVNATPRSESEQLALHRVEELLAGESGSMSQRVAKIQDSPTVRRLVAEALNTEDLAIGQGLQFVRTPAEQSALGGVRELVDELRGNRPQRLNAMKDSPRIHEFVLAALHAEGAIVDDQGALHGQEG